MSSEDAYARKEGFPTKIVMSVLAGIVVVLWFLLGYGYEASPPDAGEYEPPTIWLFYKGDTYTGLQGSYCWADRCVDTAPPQPTGVIAVEKDSVIGFTTNSLIEPSNLSVVASITIDEAGGMMEVSELESEEQNNYRVNLEEGSYIVSIFASWEGLGDVIYAFGISVI